jgi:hypothetical protein
MTLAYGQMSRTPVRSRSTTRRAVEATNEGVGACGASEARGELAK